MATLTTAVDGDDLYLVVSDLPTTQFIQLDDEIVEVEAEFASTYDRRTGTTFPNKLRVLRAALGTTAASHSGGATLVSVYGAGAAAGGSLTLDNTVDPPAEVTTLIAPGADVSVPGEADLSSFEGVQTVRLLTGTVAFDTAGVKIYPGVVVLEVPINAQVIAAGVIVTAGFTESDAVQNNVYWGFADAVDASDWIGTISATAANVGGVPPDPRIQNFDASLTLADVPPFVLGEGAQVICYMQDNVTAGALEVRVLIALPAA